MKRLSGGILSDAATLLGLGSAVFALVEVWVAFVLGSLAVIAFAFSLILRARRRRRSRDDIDNIRATMSIDRVLDSVASQLSLGGASGGWRLSLYELDPPNDCWVLRARAASNELYADARDLPKLRVSQGVLRSCLAGSDNPAGRFDEMPSLPDPMTTGWATTLIAWGMLQEELAELRMKSRSYCAAVYKVGLRTGHHSTLGVVAESEAPDGVQVRVLEGAFTRPFFEALAEMVAADARLIASREPLSE